MIRLPHSWNGTFHFQFTFGWCHLTLNARDTPPLINLGVTVGGRQVKRETIFVLEESESEERGRER